MPKDQTGTDARIGRIQIELLGEHPMVAPLRFLDLMQVGLEVLLLPEGGGVDALEHLPVLIATPVRARRMQQLEIPEVRSVGDVRPSAEIDERTVRIGRYDLIVGELAQPLQFQRIVGKPFPGLGL